MGNSNVVLSISIKLNFIMSATDQICYENVMLHELKVTRKIDFTFLGIWEVMVVIERRYTKMGAA